MKLKFTAAALAIFPTIATAETQLERLEDISERMNTGMFEVMIRMAEKEGADPEPLRAAIPDGTWDDAYREAGACMLDRFNALTTTSEIDTMLDKMDAFVAQMATMDIDDEETQPDLLPDGVTEEMSMEINMECGVTEMMMQRMDDSGFSAALMQSMMGN